jgi:putative ATP-binding cassette transporter
VATVLKIAKPYWFSQERWGARGLLALLLLFSLSVNGINVFISFVGRDFMTALASKQESKYFQLYLPTLLCLSSPRLLLFYTGMSEIS